ncbi:MAG: AzlC family ABC transporter permease [Lactobacillales bacterium]|nr:AzlC family ABC transporter permease [Lactobacillales bacterium]
MYSKDYETFVEGFHSALPTILGYVGIGLAAGVVGTNAHLSVLEVALMSTLVYAGAAQFIICGLLLLHTAPQAIILTVFLVNLRHLLMSLSASQLFQKESLLKGIGIGSLLTDESYAVLMTAAAKEKKVSTSWMNGLNLTAYLSWIFSTVIGAVIGNWIPSPDRFGLDFALVAMFAGLFVIQLEFQLSGKVKKYVMILSVVVVSLYGLMIIVTPEIAVILGTLLGCLTGVIIDERNK